MTKWIILLSAVIALSQPAAAADRKERVRALMEAQGLLKTFEQQLQEGHSQGKLQAQQALDQLLSGLNPNKEYRQRFTKAVDEFVSALQPPWGAKEIVDTWYTYYGSQFSDEELDQLIAYYTSPLGRKEVEVSRGAVMKLTKHFQEKYKPVQDAAVAKYIERLKTLAAECQCSR